MKRTVLAMLVAFAIVAALGAAGQPRKGTEGSVRYTPTRLEWLAIKVNAEISAVEAADLERGFVVCLPDHQRNAITIQVTHSLKYTDRAKMNKQISGARQLVEGHAKNYGWDSWLQVREVYLKPIKL